MARMRFAFIYIRFTSWSCKSLCTIACKTSWCIHTYSIMFAWWTCKNRYIFLYIKTKTDSWTSNQWPWFGPLIPFLYTYKKKNVKIKRNYLDDNDGKQRNKLCKKYKWTFYHKTVQELVPTCVLELLVCSLVRRSQTMLLLQIQKQLGESNKIKKKNICYLVEHVHAN